MAGPLPLPTIGAGTILSSVSRCSQIALPCFPMNICCNLGFLQFSGLSDTLLLAVYFSLTVAPVAHGPHSCCWFVLTHLCFRAHEDTWSPRFVVSVSMEFSVLFRIFCFYVGIWEESNLCWASLPSSYQNSQLLSFLQMRKLSPRVICPTSHS